MPATWSANSAVVLCGKCDARIPAYATPVPAAQLRRVVDGQVVEGEDVLVGLLGYRAARHAAALARSASRRAGFRPTNRAAVPSVPSTAERALRRMLGLGERAW